MHVICMKCCIVCFFFSEESIKALGNTPTNIQNNPIELEKAFFDKSKSKVCKSLHCFSTLNSQLISTYVRILKDSY